MVKLNLAKLQDNIASPTTSLPAIEQWDPPFCGDIDLQIKHDGTWFYSGTPIGRKSLVKLFASVLKREQDNYFLVTPVEKVGIQVTDSPFIVTQWQQQNEDVIFITNVDDSFTLSETNPLKLMADKTTGEVLPYVLVRRNLWARLHQNVFYQLVEQGTESQINSERHRIISSSKQQFSLGKY